MPPLDSSDAECLADLTLRRRIRRKYPGACSLEFQGAMQIALECLFGWEPQKQRGKRMLFGVMEAYCRADEEQGRGSLHSHWLVWIKHFGQLRRLLFAKDKNTRELARASYIAYVNKIMCARQCDFEVEVTHTCRGTDDKKGPVNEIFQNCCPSILREARHEEGCKNIKGRVMQCKSCGKCEATTDVTTEVLKNLQQGSSANSLNYPLSSERLDIAAYRTMYDVPDVNGSDPDSISRYILLNERFNQHATKHASSCFKKGCECRFLFPFLATSGNELDILVTDVMKDLILLWQEKRAEEEELDEWGQCHWSEEEIDERLKRSVERLSEANSRSSFDVENLIQEVAAVAKSIEDAADETNTATLHDLSKDAAVVNNLAKEVAKNKGTRVYDGNTPIEVMRHTLDGGTCRENRFVVEIQRPQGCQFMNVYNRVLSHIFTCNTNIAIGDSGQTWYQTLYNCKNTQSDDREPRDVVAKSVIRRLVRAQREREEREQSGEGTKEEEKETNTWVEGLSRVLSGINAATSRNVISAPMSHNLASNKGSRFHFSHDFAELLVGQLAEVLENGSDEVSAIVRICKEGRNEVTQWKDISANDYIYRPRDLEALCFYQQSMYYAKGYKKDGLSNDAGAETKQMAFEKGHPGVNFAYLSKLKRVRIPNVSLPDGSLCRIEELRVNDDAPSEEVKKKRENYAKMALLMFCPFRGENGLDVLKGERTEGNSYWNRFNAFRIEYYRQMGRLSYKEKCETEFLLPPSAIDIKDDKSLLSKQYLYLNEDGNETGPAFWVKGFDILQNNEDRMSMEQCQGRATDVISDLAPFPEKYAERDARDDSEEQNDNLVKDIAFYCAQYENGEEGEEYENFVRAYTHKRLLDPTNITHTRLVEARLASSSPDESIISSSTNNTAISGNDIGASTTTSTATPTVSNDRKSEETERGSYPTIIQLIKGSLLGGGNYDDVYSTDESDCNMNIPVPDSPHEQGCAGEDKPQQVSVPTLEGVARAVLRDEKKRLDEKQYIMYEVIACSFLLGLLTQDEDGSTLLGGLWTAIGKDTMNDIEALKQELRERGGREQLLMFVTGFAGAGKSTAIKIAQKFCYEFCKATSIMWADNTFLFTAYTGSAAAAFGGVTTVKATYIAKQGSTPHLSADEEKAFEGVRILIIDEVSFLKDDELLKLDRTLQRIGNNRQPFGGYSIIFAGDFQQNEPIQMKASQKLWHPTSSRHFENNINCAIILDGLHRFKDDEAYGRILQRLCRGEMTQDDVDKINKRYVGDDGIKLPKQFDGDTCYACETNKQRNAITAAIFQEHLRQTHPQAGDDDDPPHHTIIIKGLIESLTSSDAKVGTLRQRIIELGDTDVRQGKKLISPHLCCYIGAYFMCNSNDNLKEQGTGNGTQARLVRVKLRDNPISYGCEVWDGRKVWTVCASDVEFAEFEHYPRKGDSPRYFKLKPKKVTATAHVTPHDMTKETIPMACGVTQLPVNASDAITGHKLQGLTKDNVIVCSWNRSTNWIYVILSRVRTLTGLYLFRRLKLRDIKPPSRDYMAFLDRMRGLQQIDFDRARRRGRLEDVNVV